MNITAVCECGRHKDIKRRDGEAMNKWGRTVGLAAALLILFSSAARAEDACNIAAPTAEGPVIGAAVPGMPVCAYKGIPYAAPPVGNLRWQAPQPAPKRGDTLKALEYGPRCMQSGFLSARNRKEEKPSSEDCLYLNIWKPNKGGKFPVMVWIHGGGLMNGAGSEGMYHGDRLATQKGVILVTINYRLTIFGFLSLPELSREDPNGSSGNYGMLDQIAAIKWVHDNIAAFGGDPENVTIFGESAGGWSVCNLLASPLAAGLFQRGIIQSGGCDATKTVEEGYADGKLFLRKTRCSEKNTVACLRALPPERLLQIAGGITSTFTGQIKFIWLPKEDGRTLKETPIEAIRNGRYNKVPIMVGTNLDEIKLMTMMTPGIRLMPRLADNWYVKKNFGKEALVAIKKYYPYKKYSRPTDAIIDALGDIGLVCKCWDGAEAAAAYGPPVYYYRFDYSAHRLPKMLAAGHSTEIPLVFGNLDRSLGKLIYSSAQAERAQKLVEAMMSYWTNFAKKGDPNGQGLMNWPRYDTASRQRMYFNLPMRIGPTDNIEKCEFWRSKNIKLK